MGTVAMRVLFVLALLLIGAAGLPPKGNETAVTASATPKMSDEQLVAANSRLETDIKTANQDLVKIKKEVAGLKAQLSQQLAVEASLKKSIADSDAQLAASNSSIAHAELALKEKEKEASEVGAKAEGKDKELQQQEAATKGAKADAKAKKDEAAVASNTGPFTPEEVANAEQGELLVAKSSSR